MVSNIIIFNHFACYAIRTIPEMIAEAGEVANLIKVEE